MAQGALKLGWPVRVVQGWGEETGFLYFLIDHWMQTSLESDHALEEDSFQSQEQFLEESYHLAALSEPGKESFNPQDEIW